MASLLHSLCKPHTNHNSSILSGGVLTLETSAPSLFTWGNLTPINSLMPIFRVPIPHRCCITVSLETECIFRSNWTDQAKGSQVFHDWLRDLSFLLPCLLRATWPRVKYLRAETSGFGMHRQTTTAVIRSRENIPTVTQNDRLVPTDFLNLLIVKSWMIVNTTILRLLYIKNSIIALFITQTICTRQGQPLFITLLSRRRICPIVPLSLTANRNTIFPRRPFEIMVM